MGDHRISLKLEFEMHGHKAKNDWWLNWDDEIPHRVSEWVEENKAKAMDKYFENEGVASARAEAEQERLEREKLAELKAKYEPDA